MRNRIVVKAPGSTVNLSGHLTGKIVQTLLCPGGAIQYLVGWFDGSDYHNKWLYDFELETEEVKKPKNVIVTAE